MRIFILLYITQLLTGCAVMDMEVGGYTLDRQISSFAWWIIILGFAFGLYKKHFPGDKNGS